MDSARQTADFDGARTQSVLSSISNEMVRLYGAARRARERAGRGLTSS